METRSQNTKEYTSMETELFGAYLKRLRLERGLTLRKLDVLSGVSHAYLSQLENGKRGIPTPQTLSKIYLHLGVSYNELMEKAGHMKFVHEKGDKRIQELEFELRNAYERIAELEHGYNTMLTIIQSIQNKN